MANTKHTDRVLVQTSGATGEERTFEVYNQKFMKVSTRLRGKSRTYHINLSMMEPWPVRHRRLSWRSLMVVLAFAAGAAATGSYLYYRPDTDTLAWGIPLLAGLVFLMLGALLVFYRRSPNFTEFRSRYGGCVLISLFYKKPTAREFTEFVEDLKQRILTVSHGVTFNQEEMLAIELKELRRLANDGVVSDSAYASAKDRIMRMHN